MCQLRKRSKPRIRWDIRTNSIGVAFPSIQDEAVKHHKRYVNFLCSNQIAIGIFRRIGRFFIECSLFAGIAYKREIHCLNLTEQVFLGRCTLEPIMFRLAQFV